MRWNVDDELENQMLMDTLDKHYGLTSKQVVIDGCTYDADIIKRHSAIEAVIYHSWDDNAGDAWANIRDWRVLCYVKFKGIKTWRQLYKGPEGAFSMDGHHVGGVLHLCLALEAKRVRTRLIKRNRIAYLKKLVLKMKERIKELKKEQRELQRAY